LCRQNSTFSLEKEILEKRKAWIFIFELNDEKQGEQMLCFCIIYYQFRFFTRKKYFLGNGSL